MLCASHVEGLDEARKKLIPIQFDSRVPMDEIYELFAGRMDSEQVQAAALAPTRTDEQQQTQIYYANLYIALF